jgi:ABC-type multidrug transport system fused ATPase/permease subunit
MSLSQKSGHIPRAMAAIVRHPWWPHVRRYPIAYGAIVACIAATIPLSLMLIILVTYAFRQLQTPVAPVAWIDLVGEHASRWLRPYVRGTGFEQGVPVDFQLEWFVPALVLVATSVAFLRFASEWLLENIGESIARDLRLAVARGWSDLPFDRADTVEGALLANVQGEDAREVRQAFTRLWGSVPADALSCLFYGAFLAILDTQLFALLLAILAPAGIVIRVTGKTLKKLARQGLRSQADLLESLLEKMRGWQTIQVLNGVRREIGSFNVTNGRLFTLWRRQARARALASPLVEWLGIVAGAFVIVLALRRVSDGALTSSVLTAFLVTIAQLANAGQSLSTQLNSTRKGTEALRRAHGLLVEWFGASEAARRIGTAGRASSEASTWALAKFGKLTETVHEIGLRGLTLAHPSGGDFLAENLEATVRRGEMLAVIGPSGAGKSTLLRVILGLSSPAAGAVTVNGRAVNCSESGSDSDAYGLLAHDLAFLPQEPFVLDGTILDNVVYPCRLENPTQDDRERVMRALASANLGSKNPEAASMGLSGGERQRLMFARAFFRDATFWVMDEGTSALDANNEKEILDRVTGPDSGRVVVTVAHRDAVKARAIRRLELGRGPEKTTTTRLATPQTTE